MAATTDNSNLCSMINAQWRHRPDDERYKTLEDLLGACRDRSDQSSVTVADMDQLAVEALPVAEADEHLPIGKAVDRGESRFALTIQTDGRVIRPSHWSFAQFANAVGAQSSYLRKLDTRVAAFNLDYCLRFVAKRERHGLFLESRPESSDLFTLRAFTSPSYGRIYDSDVVEMVLDTVDTDTWRPPCHSYSGAVDSLKATTLYHNDKGTWIFLVDDRSPIEIKVDGKTETLCRGILIKNSEVGYSRFEVTCFYYRYTCSNRLLWTPQNVRTLSIRHTTGAPERFRREGVRFLRDFSNAGVQEVRDRVTSAMRTEIGHDKVSTTEWLQRHARLTKHEAGRVYDRGVAEEGRVRTLWDAIQGGTALAREKPHSDQRLNAEEKFGKIFGRLTQAA